MNQDQSNNESQPLVQQKNTYLASTISLARQVYDFITVLPPQIPLDDSVRRSSNENSPTTPIFPGSYPSERRSIVESTSNSSVSGSKYSEEYGTSSLASRIYEPDIPSASKAGEELEMPSSTSRDESEGLAASQALSHSGRLDEFDGKTSALRVSKQAREELEKHGTFYDNSEELTSSISRKPSSALRVPDQVAASSRPPVSAFRPPEQVMSSVSHSVEKLARHGALRDWSGGPATTDSMSHNERSRTPIPSEHIVTTQFQGAYGFSISGNPSFTNAVNVTHVNHYGGSRGLEPLQDFVSFNAFHNSAVQDPDRRCHPGTRVVVLKRIRNWIDEPGSAGRVFWLYGPAGAGKSAIAQTIARSCTQDQLAATFFFYRSDPNRNDGNRLFTTIAWQLAFSIPGIKDQIARSLDRRPDLPRMDVETQFEEFIVRPFQALKDVSSLQSLIVIIDGVDECTDEKLQRRFLKLIGNAVNDGRVPLRFLICSRPEAHIQETIDHFPQPGLQIDLAGLDDANNDIEKYLKDEFSRIASEQRLDSTTWPGDQRLQQFVYNSSGQFAYAATVIRYVSDEYSSAVTRLDILLGLKPYASKSPFAELDALYMEILERQPDRDFLITFLALLVARLTITPVYDGSGNDDFHLDDAMLMKVSENELHRKLRGMRSLFKFEPCIDLYHRSFLDFLQEESRSCQFYISQKNAARRYLELITDSVVRFVSKTIEQPNYHETAHFCPQFHRISRQYPRRIELHVAEWEEALQPLLHLQDKLLTLPNFTSLMDFLPCDTCTIFQIMRDLLLHLAIMQGTNRHPVTSSIKTVKEPSLNDSDLRKSSSNGLVESWQDGHEDDLVGCIRSLLSQLRRAKSEPSIKVMTIEHMCSLLRFDCHKIANRICSLVDAQIMVDFIDSLNNAHCIIRMCGPDTMRKAACLALKIYARVPVLPQSLFSNSDISHADEWGDHGQGPINLDILCQSTLLARILNHDYIVPLLRIYETDDCIHFVSSKANDSKSLIEWRKTSKPSPGIIMQAMLQVAKTLKYLHSMGAVLIRDIHIDDIRLDSDLHAKIRYFCSTSQYITETPTSYLIYFDDKDWNTYENNVFVFGCFFYEMYFDRRTFNYRHHCSRSIVSERPSTPEIPENAWQLIQRCCAEEKAERPTMDQIVHEMESWNLA